MNSAQRETLHSIFSKPIPKSLEFSAIASLLEGVGCEKIEGSGSRVRFVKGSAMIAFHRPHPGKEAKPYQIKDARDFLVLIGVTPDKEGKP